MRPFLSLFTVLLKLLVGRRFRLFWIFFSTARRFERGFLGWDVQRLRLLFIVDGWLMNWFTRVNTRLKLDVNQRLILTLGSTLEGLVLSLQLLILLLELVKLWIDRTYSIV